MREIEFISYNGAYPNLCSGELIYSVDGEIYKEYDRLLTGGSVRFSADWDEIVEEGKWFLNEDEFSNLSNEEMAELLEQVNDNVPYGCCGGCV